MQKWQILFESRTKRGVGKPPLRRSHRMAEPTVRSILKKKDARQRAVSWERNKMEKTAIRFDSELKSEIQNMMSEANATSMADFIRQAAEFYIAYLRQKKSIDFLAPLLAQTIKNEIESVEKNISSVIYKLAVEQAISNNIVAYYNGVNDETITALREMCSKDVAENNGSLTFEAAMEFKHSEDE